MAWGCIPSGAHTPLHLPYCLSRVSPSFGSSLVLPPHFFSPLSTLFIKLSLLRCKPRPSPPPTTYDHRYSSEFSGHYPHVSSHLSLIHLKLLSMLYVHSAPIHRQLATLASITAKNPKHHLVSWP